MGGSVIWSSRHFFQKAGSVSDSFIPFQQGKSRRRYGFAKFWKVEDVMNSIKMFNGSTIRGARLRVYLAKYGSGSIGNNANKILSSPGG